MEKAYVIWGIPGPEKGIKDVMCLATGGPIRDNNLIAKGKALHLETVHGCQMVEVQYFDAEGYLEFCKKMEAQIKSGVQKPGIIFKSVFDSN